MTRILYCECGEFISIDVQDMQKSVAKKCILCCVKDAIALMEYGIVERVRRVEIREVPRKAKGRKERNT